jgi:hypothetical protein
VIDCQGSSRCRARTATVTPSRLTLRARHML